MPIDVRSLGADFVVASGHKMAGPTGIGFLWAPLSLLETIPPWQGGGDMIDEVFETRSTWAPPPARFEAGTPAIAEVIGLGAACDYLARVGMGEGARARAGAGGGAPPGAREAAGMQGVRTGPGGCVPEGEGRAGGLHGGRGARHRPVDAAGPQRGGHQDGAPLHAAAAPGAEGATVRVGQGVRLPLHHAARGAKGFVHFFPSPLPVFPFVSL